MSDWSSDVCSSDLSDAPVGKECFPSAPHWGSLPFNDPGIAGQFLPRGQCIASVDKRMVCSCDHHQRVIEQPFLFNTFSRAGIGQCSNEKIEIPLAKLFSQSCLLPVDNINLNLRMGGVKASDGVRKQLGPCERHGTDDDPAYGRALQSSDFEIGRAHV